MNLLRWLSFAWANTRRNRRRSAVTVAVAALGTAAMLSAGGFALDAYLNLQQQAARNTGHLIIGKPEQFSRDEDVPLQYGLDDAKGLTQRLLADPAVRHVLPRVQFSGLISNGDKSTVMMAAGVDADNEFVVKGPFLTVTEGGVLDSRHPGSVMLGDGLARSMKAKPGTSLTLLASTSTGALNAVDVIVQGVFSTGVTELDKRLVYTDVATAQQLLVTQRISSLGVFLRGMDDTLPAQARLAPTLPGLEVQTWLDQAAFYRSVRAIYNRIFGALGLIIAVIVIFVVANAMAMAVIERTREIGTLRALGTLPGQLQRSLALEGLLLGGIGAIGGAAIALGLSLLLLVAGLQMPPPPGRSTGYPLHIAIDGSMYAGVLLGMVLLSTLASAWIARKTVNRPIVEALAHV
jgi:putative ABC transport system permease protein